MLNFEKFLLKIWRRSSGIQVTEDLFFLLENRSWVLESLGTNKRILILLHLEKCHSSELEHPWRYNLIVPSENWAHPIVLVWSPEFLVGYLLQIEAMTPMSKSYQPKTGCCPRKTTIPHDLRPSHLLLLWHLLHWNCERELGKPLPYAVWEHGISLVAGDARWSVDVPPSPAFLWLCYTYVVAQGAEDPWPLKRIFSYGACYHSWVWLHDPGDPASPVLLWFSWKLVPSDCLFMSMLGRCVQLCSFLLPWEFLHRHSLRECKGFSCYTCSWVEYTVGGFCSFNKLPPGEGCETDHKTNNLWVKLNTKLK